MPATLAANAAGQPPSLFPQKKELKHFACFAASICSLESTLCSFPPAQAGGSEKFIYLFIHLFIHLFIL